MTNGWVWVILAGVFESLWNIALKKSTGLGDWKHNSFAIIFLLIAILTFKKAIDLLPLNIAVVVWSGISIILTILLDVVFLKSKIDLRVGFFMVICILSIIGINYYSNK